MQHQGEEWQQGRDLPLPHCLGSHCNRESLPAMGLLASQSPSSSLGVTGTTQPPMDSTGAVLLSHPELHPPTVQMVMAALWGAHSRRLEMQEGAASQTTSLLWAMVPTTLPALCAKCSRRWLSDLASLTLHWCRYGAATWPGCWKRGLKSAPNCFPEGVYFLPADRHDWLYKHSFGPLRTKSNKQTFSNNLSLCDFALGHIKSDYMPGNCLLAGRWQQRAGSSKTSWSHLFSYDNNQGSNDNRLWNRIAIRLNNRWVIVPKSLQYWREHLNYFRPRQNNQAWALPGREPQVWVQTEEPYNRDLSEKWLYIAVASPSGTRHPPVGPLPLWMLSPLWRGNKDD